MKRRINRDHLKIREASDGRAESAEATEKIEEKIEENGGHSTLEMKKIIENKISEKIII